MNANFKGKDEKIPINEVLKAKSKVPVAAQYVNDDEGLKDQLRKLNEEYKVLIEDNRQAIDVVYEMEVNAKKSQAVLDKEKDKRGVEVKDGQIVKLVDPSDVNLFGKLSTKELTEKAKTLLDKKDPMDPIIAKLAARGYDASSAFEVFDVDIDEVLTKKEIKDGLRDYDINLTDDEMALLMREIDKNSDGVLTREEWEGILTPKVNAGVEYLKIMGDIKVDDPLIL